MNEQDYQRAAFLNRLIQALKREPTDTTGISPEVQAYVLGKRDVTRWKERQERKG